MINTVLLYYIAGMSAGTALFAGVSAVALVYARRMKLRSDYECEFGMEPPEHFPAYEIRASLETRRKCLDPAPIL